MGRVDPEAREFHGGHEILQCVRYKDIVQRLDCPSFGLCRDGGYMARSSRTADLGMLATRLLFGLQSELFRRSAEEGFGDLRPRHGAVTAYLDENGLRQNDLVRLSGRNKQTIGAILDELEEMGYVSRVTDPA